MIYGFVWGIIAYGLHFVWLYKLLVSKLDTTCFFSLVFYGIAVMYSAMTSAVWFGVVRLCMRFVHRIVIWIICTIVYFLFLESSMFWFFDSGYPFLNPFIPLMSYGLARLVLVMVLGFGGAGDGVKPRVHRLSEQKKVVMQKGKKYVFVYLEPCTKDTVLGCSLQIHKQLRSMKLFELADAYERVVIVGPETTFPFALNKNRGLIDFWMPLLPENANIILGSVRLQKKINFNSRQKLYQTAYWLQNSSSLQGNASLIIKNYDKTHRVVFTEKLPRLWKRYEWVRSLFLYDKLHVSKGRNKDQDKIFFMSLDFTIQPVLCSELFFMNSNFFLQHRSALLVALVNDSWFSSWFRRIMFLTANLRACFWGKSILYVSYPCTQSVDKIYGK